MVSSRRRVSSTAVGAVAALEGSDDEQEQESKRAKMDIFCDCCKKKPEDEEALQIPKLRVQRPDHVKEVTAWASTTRKSGQALGRKCKVCADGVAFAYPTMTFEQVCLKRDANETFKAEVDDALAAWKGEEGQLPCTNCIQRGLPLLHRGEADALRSNKRS
eukprot:5170589-Amphidinium_carterae.2